MDSIKKDCFTCGNEMELNKRYNYEWFKNFHWFECPNCGSELEIEYGEEEKKTINRFLWKKSKK